MSRKRPTSPTDGELEILHVLWERGPSSVRQVYRILSNRRKVAYSTILTMMQLMRKKGLLSRDETVRPQVYSPVATAAKTQTQMLDRLLQRVFGGSMRSLLVRAVSSKRLTPKELSEVRKLINEAERKGKP